MGLEYNRENRDKMAHDDYKRQEKHCLIIVGIVGLLQATVDILDIILDSINNKRKG